MPVARTHCRLQHGASTQPAQQADDQEQQKYCGNDLRREVDVEDHQCRQNDEHNRPDHTQALRPDHNVKLPTLGYVRGPCQHGFVNLTAHLSEQRRTHVETRLRGNLMAWLTTVRPDGRPDTVPVWFLLREDETLLMYSRPSKTKLANIAHNPHVTLVLDVTDVGRDVIRLSGTADHAAGFPPADQVPEYVAKYAERIGALFGTPAEFAADYSQALIITVERLHA